MEPRPLRSLRELPEALGAAGRGPPRAWSSTSCRRRATCATPPCCTDAELVDAAPALMDVRSRKSAWEVGRVRAAAVQVAGAQRHAREIVRARHDDRELQIELEATCAGPATRGRCASAA